MAVVAVLLQDGFDSAAKILVFCFISVAVVRQQSACEQAGEEESECGAVGHGGGAVFAQAVRDGGRTAYNCREQITMSVSGVQSGILSGCDDGLVGLIFTDGWICLYSTVRNSDHSAAGLICRCATNHST